MGLLFGCGLCCMLLSIWAILQLETFPKNSLNITLLVSGTLVVSHAEHQIRNYESVMGIFFKMEVLAFIEEAEPDHHEYEDYDDFMKQTKENYHKIAINCWIAAVIYAITLGLSYLCIKRAREKDVAAAEKLTDDEAFCRGKPKKS